MTEEEEKHNYLGKAARLALILSSRRLHFLGHITCMGTQCVPKKLLVCAPLSGKQAPGGQHLRWIDLVSKE